ncbi:hypothetical protein BG015_001094 [Linnemannia schmuckeri]|uniref:Uncharacterized protein n=1 Tax=Linnemannia schmuckeri TaxID=64567 RepID=A0A9P5RSN6_9FUNG|nr:hypothetical protein BG015_001094 [Linnemannia schmuckeri]
MNEICYWRTGVRRNIHHDSTKNVQYCHKYLECRLADLTAHLNKDGTQMWILKHPKVFLDESHYHLDHIAPARWIIAGTPIAEPERSPMLIIVAALEVWYDKDKKELKSKLTRVSMSGHRLGNRIPSQEEPPRTISTRKYGLMSHQRKDAGIVPPENDYHGDFSAD